MFVGVVGYQRAGHRFSGIRTALVLADKQTFTDRQTSPWARHRLSGTLDHIMLVVVKKSSATRVTHTECLQNKSH